ncbi:hypothetical protein ABE545_09505 [Sphingobacterium faecium]|uniref:hypothetical protein n=1 Tax=Sphingobacterium faecium TaxID=34087 RepID=UPI003209FBA7
MVKNDYYLEYIEVIEELLCRYIYETDRINPNILLIDRCSIEKAVKNNIWTKIFHKYRDYYNLQRKNETSESLIIEYIWITDLLPLLPTSNEKYELFTKSPEASIYFEYLSKFADTIIIYCYNKRQLIYYLPLLNSLDEEALVFVNFDIKSISINNNKITVIEYEFYCEEYYFKNSFLARNFPKIYWFGNIFLEFVNVINPRCIVVLEGCHLEMETLSTISKIIEIPCICIQQGWPSVMHTRFRNMTYDYFLTWGVEFNDLWKKYNSLPKFTSIGYLYSTINDCTYKKNAITFFLQGPFIIINKQYFDELLEVAIALAFKFPDIPFLIKEHPEYRLDDVWLRKLSKYDNISIVKDLCLSEVFGRSKISISIFSSIIMESLIHDTFPIVFEVSSVPYYPSDLEIKQLGLITNRDNILSKIERYLSMNQEELFHERLLKFRKKYFSNEGKDSVDSLMLIMNNIINN